MKETSRDSVEHEPGFQEWMPHFLEQYEELLDITQSAKVVGVSRVTVWRHLRKCPWFKREWDAITHEHVLEPLRASIIQRAINGTEQPNGWIAHETALTKMMAERRLPEYAPNATGEEQAKSGVMLVPTATFEELLRRAANKSQS